MIAWILLLTCALWGLEPELLEGALQADEARAGTLRGLLAMDRPALQAARASHLGARVARLAVDPSKPLEDRVLAVRVAALIGGDGVPQILAPLLTGAADGPARALALEAARALSQLKAVGALRPALGVEHPEVRALAARAGAGDGAALCALLRDDPWPTVRVAAARGLVHHPASAACLGPALRDASGRVRWAAVSAATRLAAPTLRAPLRALAGDAGAEIAVRAEAVVALGAQGDLEPAGKILSTHLAVGGIAPLARAAVRALAYGGRGALPRLRGALRSESPAVRLDAARALVAAGDTQSLPALRALEAGLPRRLRPDLRALILRLDPSDPPDPAALDPE